MPKEVMDTMDTKELSVWGWIAMQCHIKEWSSSADIAEFLGEVERRLWGNPSRQAWKLKQVHYDTYMDSTDYPANFLVAVARNRHLKWGCLVSGYDCENCKIAMKHGSCNQLGSMSHFWLYVLLQDSQEEVDEELQKQMKESIDRIWLK